MGCYSKLDELGVWRVLRIAALSLLFLNLVVLFKIKHINAHLAFIIVLGT